MVGFDVLNEPWIPVIALDGTSRELGILGVLLEAHRLSEVVCESPLETYAVQRFLIAFLMDAYRLPHAGDRRKLFESGCFDEKVISDYIELCRSEGVTFDLFDKERPFYQAVFDERYDSDAKLKPSANLFHAVPSGNSHVHFEHDNLYECHPSQAFRALLTSQIFAAAMTQGYPSSVNDTPCWYVLLKGNSLFETLCLSMLSVGECRGMEFDSPLPAWRDTSVEIPKTEHADISMLEGLTFRPRRLTLVCDPDGIVRKLFFQQGQSFHQNGRWNDPHVTFAVNKSGEYVSIKPRLSRMAWRDVGSFMISKEDKFSRPAKIISASETIVGKHVPRLIMLFGLVSSKAKYEDWLFDQMNIPGELLFDEVKAGFLRATMNDIEQAAALVYHTVNSAANAMEHTKDGRKKEKEAAKEAETVFFAEMHTALFAEYFPVLAEADKTAAEWERKPVEVINGCIQRAAKHVVEDYVKKLGDTAKCIEVQTNTLRFFRAQLFKILNGRKVRK
ncbi:MAG: type I-E CRISPR-associated protein Cse1/CasA [Clostridia bacterium]|nr:type I-E CRISPR-associated protein Cse1/CasA [Clostridia bacterium]